MITQRKHEEILAAERSYWQGIVTDLLNRVQAPQMAVAHSIPTQDEPSPYVSSFDDEALAQYEELRRSMVVPKGAE
jgi:hypothetical protein